MQSHRVSDKAFTRKHSLTLPNLIEIFLNTSHRSIKAELDDFFYKKAPASFKRQLLTTGAFTKARCKFKASAFTELLHKTVAYIYTKIPRSQRKSWYGFRTLAVDGSDLTLPDVPELIQTFGTQNNDSDVLVPMTKLSLLYDVHLKLPIDAQLDKKHSSERDLAVRHLKQTQENDLLLYDRGYYAYWLVLQHILLKLHFCFRVKSNACTQVKDFIQSGKKQAIITLNPTHDMKQKAVDKGLSITQVKVRLIRIKTPKGVYVLMTSLTDQKKYSTKDFYELYPLRWNIEEAYKIQKAFLDVEDFSGRTVHSIQQDVHASILIQALVAIECFASQPYIPAKVNQRKHAYAINFVVAIRSLKRRLIETLDHALDSLNIYRWLKAIARNLTIIKPDRSFERTKVRCRRQKMRTGYKI